MSDRSLTPAALVLVPIGAMLYAGLAIYAIAIVCVILVIVAISKRVGLRTGLLKQNADGGIEDSYWKAIIPWTVGAVLFLIFLIISALLH